MNDLDDTQDDPTQPYLCLSGSLYGPDDPRQDSIPQKQYFNPRDTENPQLDLFPVDWWTI